MAQITELEQARRESTAAPRLLAVLLSGFAAVALAITSVGLASALALVVRRRSREIGLRIALGALPGNVSWMVLRQGFFVLLTGVAIGLPLSLGLARLLSGQLFEVEPHDPRIFAAVTIFLMLVAGAACLVPARRAVGIDPLTTIRSD
ncbi:MAG: FtsX-like permease family protein [Vicinamibacteria bacterium]